MIAAKYEYPYIEITLYNNCYVVNFNASLARYNTFTLLIKSVLAF